jgi:ribosomal protein S8
MVNSKLRGDQVVIVAKKNKESNIEKMRKVEAKSKELYPYLKKIPNRLSKFIISIV